jgi:hypothetical protein
MLFRLLVLAALLLIHGELRAQPLAEEAGFAPKLIIYLAKGPPNSCGAGCDHWIAVEGKVDQAAASRVSRFLHNVKDTQRPIYFHSPGGAVDQAFVIGRLLRSRKAIARVGRTIVAACGAGTQVDAACLKIKTAGGEVEAEIATSRAMCNSACGYLFLGATTREVAPDAVMAVHNSHATLVFHGRPTQAQIAATERVHRSDGHQQSTRRSHQNGEIRETAFAYAVGTLSIRHRYADDGRSRMEPSGRGPSAHPQSIVCKESRRCIVSNDGVVAVLREQGSRAAAFHSRIWHEGHRHH